MQRRAITGALMAAQGGQRENLAFWRGQFNACWGLLEGFGADLAKKDAALPYLPPSDFIGAWSALASGPENLSARRVLQALVANGLEVADHHIAYSELELAGVFKEGHKPLVVGAHDEHAANGIDGNNSSLHAPSDGQTAIVATAEGGAA
jgi:hypothetical protein